jgi:vacuolar-type H+-ATPase subunit H
LVAKLNAITEQERQKGFELSNDRVAAETEADAKIRDLRRAASDQIFDAEQKAAVASVPQWEQSNAQIVADFQKRQREIDQELKDTVINSAEADRLRQANWNETNGRMAQDYASQFENLYNDMTTGSIGQRINAQMRKFFFNLLGQWAAALRQRRRFSWIERRRRRHSRRDRRPARHRRLGGSGPGGGVGSGPYGLPPGIAMSFGGG